MLLLTQTLLEPKVSKTNVKEALSIYSIIKVLSPIRYFGRFI